MRTSTCLLRVSHPDLRVCMQIILSTATLDDNLPRSIEAMFHVVNGPDVDIIRKAHRDFLTRFPLERVPLVELDVRSTSQPFSLSR